MLRPVKPSPSPDDLFIERYAWLLGRALQLTGGDRHLAEDLVHDAFIQFTLKRPDLGTIENIEGYLHRVLRNMYLSSVRRATHVQDRTISLADYDSAEMGLRGAGSRDQVQIREELLKICEYACLRKETSKVASVLILRFFHGYYPGEIAQVLRGERQAMDKRLQLARREAKLYLADPSALSFMTATTTKIPWPATRPAPRDLW